jgi:hypothetical protein
MRSSIRLLAAACCLAVGSTHAAPITSDVVFGNLGADGSGGISSTNTDIGPGAPTTLALAQGFTTGSSSPLVLQSVILGAFVDGIGSRTVSIYSNSSNAPGTALFTSSPTTVSSPGKYTYSFSGVTLSPGTSYWVVPDFSVDWSWYTEADETDQPTEQNASGYSYLGTKRQTQASPGVWGNSILPYSLSVQAVPEPSTYALAAVGLTVAGLMRARRRKAAV